MSRKPRILHVIDDATAGGVTRVVDFLCRSDALAATAEHKIHHVRRGRFGGLPTAVDVIVSHTTISWRSLPALIALRAARPDTPIIHVEHSYTSGFVSNNVPRKARFFSLLKVAFSLFDRVVAVSHAQARWIASRKLVPAHRLVTIQSCADFTVFQSLRAPGKEIKTLGAIGRLDHQKAFDLLIDAFTSVPDPSLRLKVFGTGPEEHRLRKRAANDDRIDFCGFQSDPSAPLRAVDAVIMPSRWEAYGLVAAETLVAGRQLLCARVDGLLDHEPNGATYFDEHSEKCLAAAIIRLVGGAGANTRAALPRSGGCPMKVFENRWAALVAVVLPSTVDDDRLRVPQSQGLDPQ